MPHNTQSKVWPRMCLNDIRRCKMPNNKCAHPACDCYPSGGEKFCSPYCHDAGDLVEIACDCGHPDCIAEGAVEEPDFGNAALS